MIWHSDTPCRSGQTSAAKEACRAQLAVKAHKPSCFDLTTHRPRQRPAPPRRCARGRRVPGGAHGRHRAGPVGATRSPCSSARDGIALRARRCPSGEPALRAVLGPARRAGRPHVRPHRRDAGPAYLDPGGLH
ncbi:hypothetical protein HBB16_10160 [Pseudonocardia sp. MCCB 268]|nr:hypothetical protein [Pseudonocardia cytotoxica]